ncbi:MAG: DUF1778 domain-containing protein [Sedimenticola sp.]
MAKHDRIDFRVSEEIKAQFVDAADASGMNLSTFMVAAAQVQAVRVLHQQQAIPLSDRDRDLFLAALDRPVRPMPKALRKAKAHHAALVVSD